MNIIQALILGILQGLSEFLPISSTAHLTFAGKIMGLINSQQPEHWTAFIAVIQLGTLAAVLVYFLKDLRMIVLDFIRENLSSKRIAFKQQTLYSRLGWFIIIGTAPIVTIGLVMKKVIESNITKDLMVIAISLIALGLILGLAEIISKFKKEMDTITWKDALIIGFAQCLALFPGASRSGTTITAGLFLGIKRDSAARFSFLLSIPAVLASGLLEFYQSLKYISGNDMLMMVISTIAASVSGYMAIAFLLKFLRTRSTYVFVFYRIALGIVILILVIQKIL
ncbi:MAG: undecaprenyl-diphosphatase UppP [FCB group bacterium]|jgi:undecaprenyl-diphosphatase